MVHFGDTLLPPRGWNAKRFVFQILDKNPSLANDRHALMEEVNKSKPCEEGLAADSVLRYARLYKYDKPII